MVDDRQISAMFKRFRGIDPRLYEQLIRMMDQRVTNITVAVTEAPPDQILVAQGRSREARKMFQMMTELPEDDPTAPTRPGP